MRIHGIICEYNPFHEGHAYLLTKAKSLGGAVVCVMSGNFVQRGDVAILDRYRRAKVAVMQGADLVLELPIPFSMASARYFASAGVEILNMIKANDMIFGSESADTAHLMALAERTLTSEFAAEMAQKAPHMGGAAAYYATLGEEMPGSNDILALEYCRAVRRLACDIKPIAVKRMGDGFQEKSLGQSKFASATALRTALLAGARDELSSYMPKSSLALLGEAFDAGTAPASLTHAERAILAFWRLVSQDSLAHIAGLGGGLGNRLRECAMHAGTIDELLRLAATKKYTDGAIRRGMLAAMLGVSYDDLDGGVAYTTVLAANEVGRALLSSLRKQALPILTKPADVGILVERFPERAEKIRRAACLSARADALYTLCTPQAMDAGSQMRSTAFMM